MIPFFLLFLLRHWKGSDDKIRTQQESATFYHIILLPLNYFEYKFISSGYLKYNENNVFILCII